MDNVIQNASSRSKPRSANPGSFAHCGLARVRRNFSWLRVIDCGGGQNLDPSPTNFKKINGARIARWGQAGTWRTFLIFASGFLSRSRLMRFVGWLRRTWDRLQKIYSKRWKIYTVEQLSDRQLVFRAEFSSNNKGADFLNPALWLVLTKNYHVHSFIRRWGGHVTQQSCLYLWKKQSQSPWSSTRKCGKFLFWKIKEETASSPLRNSWSVSWVQCLLGRNFFSCSVFHSLDILQRCLFQPPFLRWHFKKGSKLRGFILWGPAAARPMDPTLPAVDLCC